MRCEWDGKRSKGRVKILKGKKRRKKGRARSSIGREFRGIIEGK